VLTPWALSDPRRPENFNRFVVIEFPTFEQGVACFNSEEYKEAAGFRRRNKAGENSW